MSVLGDTWAFGPKKKNRRSKIVGAVVGGVAAASLVAVAAWIAIPDSPGFGYGRGKDAVQGLALVSVDISGNTPGTPIGPSDSGIISMRWSNPNTVSVSITELSVPAGSSIVRVDNPSCVAAPSTFDVPTQTQPFGVLLAPAGGTIDAGLSITTTNAFPSCLAGGVFKVPVLAKSVAGS